MALYHNSSLVNFENFDTMKKYINKILTKIVRLKNITYSEKNELD